MVFVFVYKIWKIGNFTISIPKRLDVRHKSEKVSVGLRHETSSTCIKFRLKMKKRPRILLRVKYLAISFSSLIWKTFSFSSFFFFVFFLSFAFCSFRLKMINENQPNHSIKLAFISLVCFPCVLFVFFFLASQGSRCKKRRCLFFRKKTCEEGKR